MQAQYELTKRFSAESSIRAYIARDPERAWTYFQAWTRDNNPHVRRLVSEGTRLRLPWAPRMGWGSPISPIMLREGEYFMLGDNTAASKDSRLWDEVGPHLRDRGETFQLGTVPRDQLIGKAFFVYWPAGHRIDWLPLLDRIGIIPDVGRMRWIR